MSVGSTELITGVGSPEPAESAAPGFAGGGADEERSCRFGRRRSETVIEQPEVAR
jgi:hypothetical protein